MSTLKIVSWNIFLGLGYPRSASEQFLSLSGLGKKDTQANVKKVADEIRQLNPDFISLQELTSGPGRFDQLSALSKWANLPHHYFAPERTFLGRSSGNAVLSKLKPHDNHPLALPSNWEKRNCIMTELLAGGQLLTILATHLGAHWISKWERLRQVETLCDIIPKIKTPVIITGDLNCEPTSKELRKLISNSKLKSLIETPTYPAFKPKNVFDQILVSQEFLVHAAGVLDAKVSDHLPVFAELSI
ncbi:MAG TPA: endonuclease/exonuclease/phosphatase family protein [Candidatus Saccharimonadales bacterium]|jgi:endonuclease/exonuclease/phosphatase family metal-dependent hydrolase